MYKCNNCQREFEQYDTIDDLGEKWYVCPYCRGTDFDEKRAKDDGFFFVEKSEVIESAVSALAAINSNYTDTAKEILTELVCDLVGESLFKYRESLGSVTENSRDKLTTELCTLLEVEKV